MFSPKSLNECYNQEDMLNILSKKIKLDQITNMLIYGNNSTCKSTLAKMIIQQRMKDLNIDNTYHMFYNYILETTMILKNNILYPNSKIIDLESALNNYIKITKPESYYKIIVIDDFDTATQQDQQKIINMLDNDKKIIFFIICENIEKLEKTFVSKFIHYFLQQMSYNEHVQYLKNIVKINTDNIDKNVLKQIYHISNGCISSALFYYNILFKSDQPKISYEYFINMFNTPNIVYIKKFIKNILINKSIDLLKSDIDYFIDNKYSYIDILEYSWEYIKDINETKYNISIQDKIHIMELISKTIIKMSIDIESISLFDLLLQRIINLLKK